MNVVGFSVDEYPAVVAGLEEALGDAHGAAVDAFELNVSCPNTKAGGHGVRRRSGVAARRWSSACARETQRPVFVKLSPTLPNIGDAARIAADAGADAISVVNTIPGLRDRRRAAAAGARLRNGRRERPGDSAGRRARDVEGAEGGHAADPRARRRREWEDALQYILAGASLVGVGTAALRDPRAPSASSTSSTRGARVTACSDIQDLSGTLEWPLATEHRLRSFPSTFRRAREALELVD